MVFYRNFPSHKYNLLTPRPCTRQQLSSSHTFFLRPVAQPNVFAVLSHTFIVFTRSRSLFAGAIILLCRLAVGHKGGVALG